MRKELNRRPSPMENLTLPDFRFIPYIGPIKEVPVWEIVVKSLIYVIITILSLIGNVLIIVIVMKNKTMKTVTNFYIVNLAVADLMVTLTCTWVTLVDNLTEGWILGAIFCKLNTFTKGNFAHIYYYFILNAIYAMFHTQHQKKQEHYLT